MKGQFKQWVPLDESEWNKWPTKSSIETLGAFTHTTFVFTLCYFLFIVDQWVLCKCLKKIPAELEPMLQALEVGLVVKALLMPGRSSTRHCVPPKVFSKFWVFEASTMRLNLGDMSQHWLCLKSPSFLSGLAVGLGRCRQYNNIFALMCPLSGAQSWKPILCDLHFYWWVDGSSMELLLRSGSCKASERVFVFTGGQLLMNFLMSVLCSVLPSMCRGDHGPTHHGGMTVTERWWYWRQCSVQLFSTKAFYKIR